MMNKKSLLAPLFAAMLLIISLLASCAKEEVVITDREIKEKIDNKIDAYRTDLLDSQDSLTTNEKIEKHLKNWADSKGVRNDVDDGIITMNVDSSMIYKDAPQTVLICPYDHTQFENYVEPIALTLYVLKNNEDTGALTAVFVPEEDNRLGKAVGIQKKYIQKDAKVIVLNGSSHGLAAYECGGSSTYRFTSKVKKQTPSHRKAYRIVISGVKSEQTGNRSVGKINPITEINSILASTRNASIDYEISEFEGGEGSTVAPSEARCVITVDADKQERFEGRLEKAKANFEDTLPSEDKDAKFYYREVPLPKRVVSDKDTSKFVSFVYTLLKGEFARNDETDELIAVTSIPNVKVNTKRAVVGSIAYSLDESVLKKIDDSEQTLCGLSGYRYKKIGATKVWKGEKESALAEALSDSYDKYTGKSLKVKRSVTPTLANAVPDFVSKHDMLALTVSSNVTKDFTGMIMDYLINTIETEE